VMNNPFMSECSHISVHFVEIRKSNFPLWTLQWKKCHRSKILVIHVPLLHLISWNQNHSLKKLSPFWSPGQIFLDHVLMIWGQPKNRDKFWKSQFWLLNSRNGDNMGVNRFRYQNFTLKLARGKKSFASCGEARLFFPWANFWRWRNFHTWNSAHSEILYSLDRFEQVEQSKIYFYDPSVLLTYMSFLPKVSLFAY
jgi:hypothetical protein